MTVGVLRALMLFCGCVCATSVLTDCGGRGTSSPSGDSDASGATANGGSATAGDATVGRAGATGVAGTAGNATQGCGVPTADGFTTKWVPPRAVPGACTFDQAAQEYALCEINSPTYDTAACHTFNIDPKNAKCLGCLFTAVDGDVSGAVQVLPGNYWQANIGGCDALIDGDSSPTSCGAREQAADLCEFEACIKVCPKAASDEDWTNCENAASNACAEYSSKTSCSELPSYAACNFQTFAEYYTAFANLFCGAALPALGAGGAEGVSGAAGAGGAP